MTRFTIFTLLAASLLAGVPARSADGGGPSLLVSPAWLAAHLNDSAPTSTSGR